MPDTGLPSPAQLFCVVQIEMLPHGPGHETPYSGIRVKGWQRQSP